MWKAIAALVATVLVAALALGAAPARAEVVWLCKPGIAANPCGISQDTTLQERDGPDRVVVPPNGPRRVDCFYVYPTVSNQLTRTANKDRDPELVSIAKYQAARFSTQCRVFAPIYRQRTLAALGAGLAGLPSGDREVGYQDVREAWRDYMANENDGRGVVLIGHSQGTFVLRRLLREEIERRPRDRRALVSALLLGGSVTVAENKMLGGDFRRTALCTRPVQVGCVVAFSTFAEDPPAGTRFGTATPGLEVACTDPRALVGSEAPLRLLTPSEAFAPGPINLGIILTAHGLPPTAPTTWVSPPDRFDGACRRVNGAHVLRLEPRPGSRTPMWYPEPSWGTHLIDVNIALEPLVALVRAQARRWTRPRLRLAAGCSGAAARVAIAGPEAEFAREAVFKVGGQRVARDRSAPLRVRIANGAGSRGDRVRAIALLRHGARERVVLERRLPRCG
jgi:Protein of unknown function (DUF3089)